jgi:glycosyltransferase involved in cell wall biosynthesis
MRVAIVHHWFVSVSGGERVVDALCQLFPEADIFTLFCQDDGLPAAAVGHSVTASFLNLLPGARRYHRQLLPLYPLAVESLDLSGYDIVISSDSGPVKGVITDQNAVHVCYCHSPMRYLWDAQPSYEKAMSLLPRAIFKLSAHYVRNWDQLAAQRVDYFIANSNHVAGRISKYYRRESTVLYPPVETTRGVIAEETDDYYLAVGRLVSYKRTDLLIQACNSLRRKLVIVGAGPELKRLQRIAGPTIRFAGALGDDKLWQTYARCRALLFAAEEDFGIVPLEAQACGRPVIAFGRGGALETVRGLSPDAPPRTGKLANGGPTGIFFESQTVDSVVEAMERFEAVENQFDPERIQARARQFDTSVFLREFTQYLQGLGIAPSPFSSAADPEDALKSSPALN